jgi:type I restriction enzyme S subunit
MIMASAPSTPKAGWEVKTLGEVCVVDWGNTALTKKSYVDEGEFLAVSAAGCDGRINHAEHKKHTPILSAIGAQCGRMFFPEEDFTAIKNTITLTPVETETRDKFLFYLLTSVELPKRGAAQPFISKGDIKAFHICLPPLPEQERIVGILDEAFEGIAAATAQAEKNLHNARELFQSVLQSTFSQKGDDWVEAELDEITESTQIGLVRNKKSQGDELPYRYVKMNNIGNDNTYNETNMVSVDADAVEVEKFSLRKGDLLFNTRNSHELVGKSCIYQSDSDSVALYNNNIMRIRFLENIKEEFAAFAFSSKQAVDQLDAMVSGTTNVAAIYYRSLRHLKIPVPPLSTQQAIVEKLDALSEETKALEAIYERKQSALAELKQSLLQKAFAGEL